MINSPSVLFYYSSFKIKPCNSEGNHLMYIIYIKIYINFHNYLTFSTRKKKKLLIYLKFINNYIGLLNKL